MQAKLNNKSLLPILLRATLPFCFYSVINRNYQADAEEQDAEVINHVGAL